MLAGKLGAVVVALAATGCTVAGENFEDPPVDPPPGDAPFVLRDPVPVVRVIDGDTLEVQVSGTLVRVRMKGVDSPELHPDPPGSPPQPYAEAARDYTLATVGTDVDLEFDSHCASPPLLACRDIYDRVLAYVRLADGSDMGRTLLSRGLARVYIFQNESFDRQAAYLAVESQARGAGLGLWGGN